MDGGGVWTQSHAFQFPDLGSYETAEIWCFHIIVGLQLWRKVDKFQWCIWVSFAITGRSQARLSYRWLTMSC